MIKVARTCREGSVTRTAVAWSLFTGLAATLVAQQPTPSSESAEDRKAAAELGKLVGEAKALLEQGDRAGARAACRGALEAAHLDDASAAWLAVAADALWQLGYTAHGAGDLRVARDAWAAVRDHRAATLPNEHPKLQTARGNLAIAMLGTGDLRGALALLEQVLAVYSKTLPDDHLQLQITRQNLAVTKKDLGDLHGALALEEKVLQVLSQTLPDDHARLQGVRGNLATTRSRLGDLRGALALQEQVLDVFSRKLPDDHLDLQRARGNLALTKRALGDLSGALALEEKVLEVRARVLPDEHPDLQAARQNLAITKKELGDLRGALALQQKAFDVRTKTLPDHHPVLQSSRLSLGNLKRDLGDVRGALALHQRAFDVLAARLPDGDLELQGARHTLALTKKQLGDLQGALALLEKVYDVRTRTLPDDHPDLQTTRVSLADVTSALGDLPRALALAEKAVAVRAGSLPSDHPDLQQARATLAGIRGELGDLNGALALKQEILDVYTRTLPNEHSKLQRARGNLAVSRRAAGDLHGANALFEKVLAVFSSTFPDDHPDVQAARANLAGVRLALGDAEGANALFAKVHEVASRKLPADHLELQAARANLAITRKALGDLEGALALEEKVLEVRARVLPDDHADLQTARQNLAITKKGLGDLRGALALEQAVFATRSHHLPDDHPHLQTARLNLAATRMALGQPTAAAKLHRSVVAHELRRMTTAHVSTRSAAQFAMTSDRALSYLGSQLDADAVAAPEQRLARELAAALARDGLGLLVAVRSAEGQTSQLLRAARSHAPATTEELVQALASTSAALEAAVALPPEGRRDANGNQVSRDDAIREAALAKDAAERSLGSLAPPELRATPAADRLAAGLADDEAAVAFLAYTRWTNDSEQPWLTTSERRLAAFVLTPTGDVQWRSLAPQADIEACIAAIRAEARRGASIGARSADALIPGARFGRDDVPDVAPLAAQLARLRKQLLDPVLVALPDGTKTIVLSPADEMLLMPIEDVPLSTGALFGEAFDLRTVPSLRVLMQSPPERSAAPDAFVVGGVDYDAQPETVAPVAPGAATPILEEGGGEAARRGATNIFQPLPGTEAEAHELAAVFADAFGGLSSTVLRSAAASEAAFVEHAPGKTYLHLATHGYFAPESAWGAAGAPGQRDALARFDIARDDRVAQLSPFSLTGIALAGANLPADELGRREGILTAQEILQLDLSSCYLATMSACNTSLGVRRGGVGLASLRQAFHAAGARFVLATPWEVDDAEAMKLMADFYTRLWKGRETPRAALRAAKKAARERGAPFRDWAGWMITGR